MEQGGGTWTCQGRHGRIGSKGVVKIKAKGVSYTAAAAAYHDECNVRKKKNYTFESEDFGTDYPSPEEIKAKIEDRLRIARETLQAERQKEMRSLALKTKAPRSEPGPVHFL